jgi:hypothetical protein
VAYISAIPPEPVADALMPVLVSVIALPPEGVTVKFQDVIAEGLIRNFPLEAGFSDPPVVSTVMLPLSVALFCKLG